MGNPFQKIKKLKGRSLKEIQTRGGQAMAAYTEKIGLGGGLLSDEELMNTIRPGVFAPSIPVTPEILLEKFYSAASSSFFPSLLNINETLTLLEKRFGPNATGWFLDRAEKIVDGRHDVLGFKDLNFGSTIDWHFEPISETHCPVNHWKQYDELDSKETGDKKVIWEFNRHSHFFVLGVAFQLTGNEKFARCFVEHIQSWMDQNPPGMGVNWVSSLEAAFRSMSWIWAFNLFRSSQEFTAGVFVDALKYLYAHGRHIETYLSTYYSPNTHLTGEALGLYYLGTQLEFFERSEHWRKIGEKILIEEIDRQIHPDGVYFEQSTWYQKYTTDFYTQFLVLQKLNGDKLPAEQQGQISRTLRSLLDCQMHFTRPDGTTPLIGDDDGGKLLPVTSDASDDFRGSLAVGAVIFGRGDYKWVAGEPKQDLLWLLGAKGISVFDALRGFCPKERSKGFEDGGFYVMRDGWGEEDNYLVVDAGQVGSLKGAHGHADTLSIELVVGGRTMLVDSGTYTYHKSKEVRNYYRSSAAHNTLTIDGQSSSRFGNIFSWETMAEPTVNSWITQDRFDFFEASHDGYKHLENSSADYTRSILFLKNEYWIMRDFVKTAGEHEYQQNFHFDAGTNPIVRNIGNGLSCVDESPQDKAGLRIFTFGDNGGWQRKDNWISKRYGERVNAPFLRYVSKGLGPQEFMTFMIPNEPGFQKPVVMETEVAGGRAFVVNYRNYQDLFVFSDGGQIIRTELFNTDFKFLWARMSQGDKLPEEFVLIDGSNFSLGGRDVLNHPTPVGFATARRFGNNLNVRTSDSVFRVSLPEKSSRTYILKTTPDDI